jgi:hypothetical protein
MDGPEVMHHLSPACFLETARAAQPNMFPDLDLFGDMVAFHELYLTGMDSSGWIKLIRQIPTELQELLTLTTQSGVEISLQAVARVEDDHLVVRGRLSGTNDQDRLFLIPYDRIVYAGFQRTLSPATIGKIYGEVVAEAPRVAVEPTPEPESATVVVEPPPPPSASPKTPTKPKIGKSELLKRIRQRNEAVE